MDRVPDLAEDDEVEDGQDAEGDQVDEEQIHPVNVDLQQTNTTFVLCSKVSYALFISLLISKLFCTKGCLRLCGGADTSDTPDTVDKAYTVDTADHQVILQISTNPCGCALYRVQTYN